MEKKAKILIIEDEESIREGLIDVFTYHGYEVSACKNGSDGLQEALNSKHDLVILDIMLPGIDGFSVCKGIREVDRKVLIIMLTAKTNEDDIINGLSLGADDYVAKPFSIRELVLRVEIFLRRANKTGPQSEYLTVGDNLKIDISKLAGSYGNENKDLIEFTKKEVEILSYLAANPERAVSRDELLAEVWGFKRAENIETRTVDIHIAKIRRKIEPVPKKPVYLITDRGEGYRLLSKDSK